MHVIVRAAQILLHSKDIFEELVKTVAFLVDNNVQHNDIHSGNIGLVFTSNKRDFMDSQSKGSFSIKLLDFGLSELMRSKGWKTRNRPGMPTVSAPDDWLHRSCRAKLCMSCMSACIWSMHVLINIFTSRSGLLICLFLFTAICGLYCLWA